ncbi:hypothetical protein SDC9_165291 [bioreactor metagenome]|uniref:Uncharacterized protein n=1 Tax=bioreactor metagenome TaxID=1076179 RepID=A0A645G1C4_9ZZZZ
MLKSILAPADVQRVTVGQEYLATQFFHHIGYDLGIVWP